MAGEQQPRVLGKKPNLIWAKNERKNANNKQNESGFNSIYKTIKFKSFKNTVEWEQINNLQKIFR